MKEEYKILNGTNESVQKILNQWKHDYDICIHGFNSTGLDNVAVLLIRTRKE